MGLSNTQQVFTNNIALLIIEAKELEIGLTFGHAWRSLDDQKRLVAEGKSRTLKSKHLDRLAVDFNFFINGKLTYDKHKLKALGDYWESLHQDNEWGGNWTSFVDTPHFQMNY